MLLRSAFHNTTTVYIRKARYYLHNLQHRMCIFRRVSMDGDGFRPLMCTESIHLGVASCP